MKTAHQTQAIIIGIHNYGDNDQIITALSAEFGRIQFVAHNSKRLGKKRFPLVDLFRVITFEFSNSKNSEFSKVSKIELLQNFDSIAGNYYHLQFLSWIADFLRRNSIHGNSYHLSVQHLLDCLKALGEIKKINDETPWKTSSLLAFFSEQGYLPEDSEAQEELRQILMQVPQHPELITRFDKDYWQSIYQWCLELCYFHELKIPDPL